MIVHGQKLLKTIKPPIRDKAKVIAKASIDAWVKRGADKLMSIVGEDALTNLNDPTFVKGYVGTVLAVLDAMEAIGEATRFLSKIKPAEADNYYDEIDRVIPQLYTKYPALEKAKIFEEEFGDGVLLAYSIMEGYMNNDTKFSKDTFAVKFVHEEPNFTDEETEEQENEVKTSKALLEDDPNNPPVIDSLGADKAKLAAAEPMTSINTSTVDSTEDIMASLDKEFNKSEDKPTVNVVELV